MTRGLLDTLRASTRARILSAFVVLLAASTVAATIGQRQLLLDDAIDRVDRQLESDAQQLRQLAAASPSGTPSELFATYLRQNVPSDGEGLYTFVGDRPGPSAVGRDIPPTATAAVAALARADGAALATTDVPGDGRIRYVRVPVTGDGRAVGSLVAIADLTAEEARATRIARNLALVALVVLVIATAFAYVIAGRTLAPLRRLGDTAAAISETDLTRRLDVEGDDELARLAATFNAMLDRLEAAFSSQRAFVSDAGHELRTPITIIRAHLDLIGDDPAERAATLALVSDELRRMSRLVEDLLTLAKAEQADFLLPEDIDLDELTEELATKARGLGDRDWRVERADPGLLRADRQRLTQAVMNLAANAVAHTGAGDRIAISGRLAGSGDEVILAVADGGPGIPPEDQERIFERFQRAGERRRDGAGLGLAIVRLIAEAHGGHVTLDSSPAGSRFSIHLPVDPEENRA